MTKKEIEDFWGALYEQRLIVLLETPDMKSFRKVELSPEQFKKVSDAIVVSAKTLAGNREGYEVAELHLLEEWEVKSDHFEGLSSVSE